MTKKNRMGYLLMKKSILDYRFYLGYLLAHILLYFTYNDDKVFWYMFTSSMLILISFSIVKDEVDDAVPISVYFTFGILSGLLLYGLFIIGDFLFSLINFSIQDDVDKLYKLFSPTMFWHYLSLMLIAIPGEEIFWRGFILKKLLKNNRLWSSIVISSFMYASVNIYIGEWILVLATFIAGMMWGYLYTWKRSIPLVIVSHLVFDLFLFILFPL
jgi:uncharacterized protein